MSLPFQCCSTSWFTACRVYTVRQVESRQVESRPAATSWVNSLTPGTCLKSGAFDYIESTPGEYIYGNCRPGVSNIRKGERGGLSILLLRMRGVGRFQRQRGVTEVTLWKLYWALTTSLYLQIWDPTANIPGLNVLTLCKFCKMKLPFS